MPVPLPNPYCAYLRVYEPLAAFDEKERAAWQSYAGHAQPRAQRLSAEHRNALAGVLSMPPRPVPSDEPPEAFVLEAGGTVLVCPVQARLRSWMALGQFRDGLPETLLHAFVPPGVAGTRRGRPRDLGPIDHPGAAAHPHRHLVGADPLVRRLHTGRS